jgi:hypothetical protein
MGKIVLPAQFLPCIDDHLTLRVMADWCEEHNDPQTARHLRWTANEWEWRRGMRRADVVEGMDVWARFWNQGWSRAVVTAVTPRTIKVSFPHRRRPVRARGGTIYAGGHTFAFTEMSLASVPANENAVVSSTQISAVTFAGPDVESQVLNVMAGRLSEVLDREIMREGWQTGERAWWDLEARGPPPDGGRRNYPKPKPRKGYGAVRNAALAKALTEGINERPE